ncbi:hypothetical protein [Gemmatimonas sp.]|uniref:hypothetical protein n=1 Tax=Gemmatimonas sp. TaxID=1962908 RepID=UPI0025C2B01E|nr:hypothetical protein [Gemmatimonas sp.]MCA2992063.1 hypothetical protein [Gemmatimonas sp.]
MPSIASAAAGAWSSTATWAGGVVPGNGDDVTIAHAVTLADARTIGRSGIASTVDLTIQIGASLTIQNGGTLTVRGSANFAGVLRIEGGGTYRFDASLAASPSTTSYALSPTSDAAGCRLELAGTSDTNRAVITSVRTNGGAKGWISGEAGLFVMSCDMNWYRISELGHHSTLRAITSAGYGARRYVFRNGVVEASVDRILASTGSSTDVLLENVLMLQSERFELGGSGMPDAGKQIVVNDSTFLCELWTPARAIEFRRSYFYNGLFASEDTAYCSVWLDNFVEKIGDGGGGMTMIEPGSGVVLDRTYMLQSNGSATNPHWVGWRTGAPARTILMRRWLFEAVSTTSADGDIVFAPNGVGRVLELEQCITVPNPAGQPGGALVNKGLSYPHSGTLRVRHCTVIARGLLGGLYLDENGENSANTVPECANNIAWSPVSAPGALVYRDAGSNATTGVGSGWGYNVFHNVTNPVTAENPKLGYEAALAGALVSGTLSGLTTDLDNEDPQFVDASRNLVQFGRTVGGYSGTDAAVRTSVLAALRARPNPADANYNAAVSIPALIDWVTAGFAPQNAALDSASDALVDGWRGAVVGVLSTPPSIGRRTSAGGAPLRSLTRSRLAGV